MNDKEKDFKVGDQIAYFPNHTNGDINHPDTEFGFITGFNSMGSAFCRYWLNPDKAELRTKANSESTPIDMIRHHKLKLQEEINVLLKGYGYI